MSGKMRGNVSRMIKYGLTAAGVLIACSLVILAGMIGIIPDTVPQDYAISPDGRTRISVVLEAHGAFGPAKTASLPAPNTTPIETFSHIAADANLDLTGS